MRDETTRGAVVWGTLVVLLLVVLVCIGRYGRDVPLAEDWLLVAPMTGHEADLPAWLWAQNNEHRTPLPRLLYLGLLLLVPDFRVGMVFNTLALGALAAAFVLTARRLRGHTRLTDAFFPLVLLHLGHWENLVWGWQIQFVVAVVLTCVLLLVVLRSESGLPPRMAPIAAVVLALLPLTGANGLIVAWAMAPWCVWQGVALLRRGRRGAGVGLMAAVAGAVVLSGLYFVGYQRATWNPPSPGPAATLWTAARFLSMSLGPASARVWAGAVLVAGTAAVLAGAVLLRALRRASPPERPRLGGLLAFGGGMAALALAVGWGRAGLVPAYGMPDRYALMAVPLLLATYFAWELYGAPRLRRWGPWALLGVLLLALPVNVYDGFKWRNWYVRGADAVLRDVAAGVPRQALAERHQAYLLHWNRDLLEEGLAQLRYAGIGPFSALREDPAPSP